MKGRKDRHNGRRDRIHPTVGDLDLLGEAPPPSPDDPPLPRVEVAPEQLRRASQARNRREPPRWRLWVALALAVLLAVVAALWFNQDHLRGMVPRTQLNDVLTRADQALGDGHLEGAGGARQLFESARALEPDNERARNGLHQVGMAELAQADAAYQVGKLREAEARLADARAVLGGGRDVDHLESKIRHARGAALPTAGLIDQAQAALAAGNLDGQNGAAALYQRVLAVDHDNAVAGHGLDKVGAALADQARAAFAANDAAAAADAIDRLAAVLPNYSELPELRATQEQSRQRKKAAVAAALSQGQQALRAGRISGRGDDTALAHFKQALALDPDNAPAQAGLAQVAQALVVQANAALDGDDTYQAKVLLDRAEALAPASDDLAAARARWQSAEAAEQATVADLLSPQQQEQVADLIERARSAAARGQIMLPPGASAYDLYRSALAIDGNNLVARQGLRGLPGLVENQLRQALARHQLSEAVDLLHELGDLAPADASQLGLRQKLASAWLEQAEQQLARGDRGDALQSLQQARQLAPDQPGVRRLAEQLQGNR